MNITMIHDLDTGFLAATLKPAFEALGHKCTVMQTITTYLEGKAAHVDILLSKTDTEELKGLQTHFKETDIFIVRSITDFTLRAIGVLPHLTQENTIFKVHGSELREKNVPYSMRTWRINWHGKEPLLVGPRDPSLFPLYRHNTMTHIERPCAFDTFPRKRTNKQNPFALTTPTNIERKGTQYLLDNWKSTIPLQVIHGVPRQEALKYKSQASYYIDNIGSYKHGPYGMNSVEAWFYRIPVFSNYNPMDQVIIPDIHKLIHHAYTNNIEDMLTLYSPDKKQLAYAYSYAKRIHDPLRIAHQYTLLL